MKKAFTLAEVLLTLAIIGIVAAVTIPSLIANTEKQAYVSSLLKTYSDLSQVYKLILLDNGGTVAGRWPLSISGYNTMMNDFASKMNISNKCNYNEVLGFCYYPEPFKTLDGNDETWISNSRILMTDGRIIFFISNINKEFYVDVNGIKPPNQIGRDVFHFYIVNNSIKPYDYDGTHFDMLQACTPNNSGLPSLFTGASCTARVIKEGAMNY